MKIAFSPVQALFKPESALPQRDETLRTVFEDFKTKDLAGVPETSLEVTFQPDDESDILIRKVDPEKAQGYQTYRGEEDYFAQQHADLYVPELIEGRTRGK